MSKLKKEQKEIALEKAIDAAVQSLNGTFDLFKTLFPDDLMRLAKAFNDQSAPKDKDSEFKGGFDHE